MSDKPNVGLFVTCLVDLFRPSVGFASAKLLEEAGCTVDVPMTQTCCGQPAYKSGDRADARAIAESTIQAFEEFDYVVAPSGSCAGMLKKHYPGLFKGDVEWEQRAEAFSAKVYELTRFLVDVRGLSAVAAKTEATAAYHSCLPDASGIDASPRTLLASVEGLTLIDIGSPDACCGLGGGFPMKYRALADTISKRHAADIEASGAELLLSSDLGCMMGMAGKLKRQGSTIAVRHVAEVLAGMADLPPIGVRAGSRNAAPAGDQ
ncbi:L-lactate dehydrogenase complex protein LldE [Mesorhizobium albiziae]|uniref:L-lactate dehydrogenase complex protein LldE n=1 Tax=Neomesorhizobium albiziae TaxID=335020 RepID=A0A1I4B607_9HYPH|nr:(Fe-S)-binding protein [Mesorhizobium albiziae]GLS34302.1 Fe-S oxidoreductase [Mesorhizobium albiziae]SFK63296.1 L-lactate dehydrogenase complex protein LldE [Mesorhizobium albiziae]